jgi:hypothetical protein
MTTKDRDPDHPIIQNPWQYRITGFSYKRSLADSQDSYIDLTLQKDEVVRRLRFHRPQDIRLDEGFPECSGLFISDVRERRLEGLAVRVGDFEASPGGVWFWAHSVEDLDAHSDTKT